jgi:Nickel responsive protein SCO4226-like
VGRVYRPGVPRYIIVRSFDVGEPEMPAVGRRSREIVEQEFPEITWEHSHVVVDDTGKVRTFCIYSAPNVDVLHQHSSRLGQHAIDSIDEIAGDVTPADFPPA